MIDKATNILSTFGASIKSIAKIALQTKRPTLARMSADRSEPLVILGNGPSLNDTLAAHRDLLAHSTTMAVNFAANTEVFREIKPQYYILADPHFFTGNKEDPNLSKLGQSLASVDWHMTLIVPVAFRKKTPAEICANSNITIATTNVIGIEGWRWLTSTAYTAGRGMPRPRNVLIAAIMSGILLGYDEIYIVGADHSWMKTISVNERNEVISIQPHFYKEDEKELERINTTYIHYPLHQIVESFAIAFKSYHDIEAYARRRGIKIYNSTPGSFIDAFQRKALLSNSD